MPPVLTSLAPLVGHTGGKTFVEIVGSGFVVPPDPPATGVPPAPDPPRMRVLFGGVPAERLEVAGEDVIWCRTPIHDAGVVDVVVQELAEDLETVVASATLAGAFTFARPRLDKKMPPTLALEALMAELRRQVIENVSFATHTDYDDDTGDQLNVADMSELPAIVLAGVEVDDSPDRRVLGQKTQQGSTDDRVVLKSPPDVVDITMMLVAATDDPVEAMNLFSVLRRFFRKLGKLRVPTKEGVAIDPTVPRTYFEVEVDWRQGLPAGITLQGQNENLLTVSGQVALRGVPSLDMPLAYTGAQPEGAVLGDEHEATVGVTFKADGPPTLDTQPKTDG